MSKMFLCEKIIYLSLTLLSLKILVNGKKLEISVLIVVNFIKKNNKFSFE